MNDENLAMIRLMHTLSQTVLNTKTKAGLVVRASSSLGLTAGGSNRVTSDLSVCQGHLIPMNICLHT